MSAGASAIFSPLASERPIMIAGSAAGRDSCSTAGGPGPLYPFVTYLGVPIANAGIGRPGSNAHAPNEHVYVEEFLRGAKHIARILAGMADLLLPRSRRSLYAPSRRRPPISGGGATFSWPCRQGLFKFTNRARNAGWMRPALCLRVRDRSGTVVCGLTRVADRARQNSAANLPRTPRLTLHRILAVPGWHPAL